MTRSAEAPLFLILAALLHLALLAVALRADVPEAGGGGGGGGGGMRSVAAAPAEIAALVEAWETPPETSEPTPTELSSPAPRVEMPRVAAAATPQAARLSEALPLPAAPPAPFGALPPVAKAPPPEETPEPPDLAQTPAEPVRAARPDEDAQQPSDPAPRPETAPLPERKPVPPREIDGDELARPAAPKPEPQPQEMKETVKRPDASSPREETAAASGPSSAAASADASSGRAASAGAGSAGAGGGTGAQDAKLSLGTAVRAAIEREKSYPRRARLRRLEGQLVLRVTISRAGGLIGAGIVRSSGEAILDEAALDAARTVGRYPSAPGDLPGTEFSFVIPIAFHLR